MEALSTFFHGPFPPSPSLSVQAVRRTRGQKLLPLQLQHKTCHSRITHTHTHTHTHTPHSKAATAVPIYKETQKILISWKVGDFFFRKNIIYFSFLIINIIWLMFYLLVLCHDCLAFASSLPSVMFANLGKVTPFFSSCPCAHTTSCINVASLEDGSWS